MQTTCTVYNFGRSAFCESAEKQFCSVSLSRLFKLDEARMWLRLTRRFFVSITKTRTKTTSPLSSFIPPFRFSWDASNAKSEHLLCPRRIGPIIHTRIGMKQIDDDDKRKVVHYQFKLLPHIVKCKIDSFAQSCHLSSNKRTVRYKYKTARRFGVSDEVSRRALATWEKRLWVKVS